MTSFVADLKPIFNGLAMTKLLALNHGIHQIPKACGFCPAFGNRTHIMDDYEKFVAECKKIKKENRTVLDGFQNHLESKKLSDKTIDKHVSNMEYYINDFLLYEEPLKPRDGIYEINYFLGYWFIKKALWASVSTIKENITSLKHFYTYMNDIGQISAEELDDIKIEIKENKEEWLEAIKKYDDPDVDFDDVW